MHAFWVAAEHTDPAAVAIHECVCASILVPCVMYDDFSSVLIVAFGAANILCSIAMQQL